MSKKQILIDYDQYHSDLNKAKAEGRSQKAHEIVYGLIDMLNGVYPKGPVESGIETSPIENARLIAKQVCEQLIKKNIPAWEAEIVVIDKRTKLKPAIPTTDNNYTDYEER